MKKFNYEEQKYILSWIDSIAPSLKTKVSFEDWINGFEDRYNQEIECADSKKTTLLQLMKEHWSKA